MTGYPPGAVWVAEVTTTGAESRKNGKKKLETENSCANDSESSPTANRRLDKLPLLIRLISVNKNSPFSTIKKFSILY